MCFDFDLLVLMPDPETHSPLCPQPLPPEWWSRKLHLNEFPPNDLWRNCKEKERKREMESQRKSAKERKRKRQKERERETVRLTLVIGFQGRKFLAHCFLDGRIMLRLCLHVCWLADLCDQCTKSSAKTTLLTEIRRGRKIQTYLWQPLWCGL